MPVDGHRQERGAAPATIDAPASVGDDASTGCGADFRLARDGGSSLAACNLSARFEPARRKLPPRVDHSPIAPSKLAPIPIAGALLALTERGRLFDRMRRFVSFLLLRWCLWMLRGVLGAAALVAVTHAQPIYEIVAELALRHPGADATAWEVTDFTAQISIAGFPRAAIESTDPKFLRGIAKKLNEPRQPFPVPLATFVATLNQRDSAREWLAPDPAALHAGYQMILLRYRNRPQVVAIDVHLAGEDQAAPPAVVALPPSAPAALSVRFRPTPGRDVAQLQAAAMEAATTAANLAAAHGFVPGGSPGDANAIRDGLTNEFLFSGVRVGAQDYSVQTAMGRAVGLSVQPVFIPRRIVIELSNWAAEEDPTKWDQPSVDRLRARRHQRETAIREELGGVLPPEDSLVTAPRLAEWQRSAPGRKYSIAPLRYEDDTLVLGASDYVDRNDYVATVGAAYTATDGVQGTASARVVHDRRVHFEVDADGTRGAQSDSASATLRWAPKQPVAGWKFTSDGRFETMRRDEALFGDATVGGTPVGWRHWCGSLAANASFGAAMPAPTKGRWPSMVALTLQLARTDDAFSLAPAPSGTPLPPSPTPVASTTSGVPDNTLELKGSWRTATLLGADGATEFHLGAQLRLAQALAGAGSAFDYRLGELQVAASATLPLAGHPWKVAATTRLGRSHGALPLAALFRAGGDQGWIRGLREGELAGRDYWAQSLAAGPDVTALLGHGAAAGGPRAFLLAFADVGSVRGLAGRWVSAQGYGVAANLAGLPISDGVAADLYVGYAYSPQSQLDRHGAVFVRLDLPFGN